MGWATGHIARLKEGETVCFRPRGNSMTGKIASGQLCTVEPLDSEPPRKGEIVLCTVRGSQYLHLVSAIRGDQYQISNNHGHVNGWTTIGSIYGRLTRVD